MKKPEVGQVLYSLNVGNAARNREQKLTKVIVTKVGRKYFTCKEEGRASWFETQYHLSDWREKSESSADSILYESPQRWEDKKEAEGICKALWEAFEYGRNCKNISLDQLRAIEKIINPQTYTSGRAIPQ